MVELKSSKEIYAMKVIKKSLVMDEEVNVLCEVSICHLYVRWGRGEEKKGDREKLQMCV